MQMALSMEILLQKSARSPANGEIAAWISKSLEARHVSHFILPPFSGTSIKRIERSMKADEYKESIL